MARSLKIAAIGAGVAGLVTARELQREGHQVTVFEKSNQIGGTWVYNPQVESDPLGLDPKREIVHSSLYYSLQTNLPRHLMGFSDYPFNIKKNGVVRDFPGHQEVLQFLSNFVQDFGLMDLLRFDSEVVRVEQENDRWVVEWRRLGEELSYSEEIFDAVVVCNGHYTQPKVAHLPGIEKWPGKQIHSHNYRVPEPFRDQVVVVVGEGPSATDICQEISEVAKEVLLSSRSLETKVSKLEVLNNLWQHLKIDYCYENGEVAFEDGASVAADIILHCTGYKYDFSFVRTNGIVTIDDNRVGPLYKHIFPPQLAPGLSFVGLLIGSAVIFFMLETQAKWVASVLSEKVILPSKVEMLGDVEEHYRLMEENGAPKHHTHRLPPNPFEYLNWIAAQVGMPPDEEMKETLEEFINIYCRSWVGYREKYVQIKMNSIN